MSFSAAFWHPDFTKDEGFKVVSDRLKRGKHINEGFVQMVVARAACHDAFGDRLNLVSKSFVPAEETGSMKSALDSVAQSLAATGAAQKQLASKLTNEVVAPLARLLEDHAKVRKDGKRDVAKCVKDREAQYEKVKKSRKVYETKMKEAEAARVAAERGDPKLKTKSDKAEKSLTDATRDYQQSTELLSRITRDWSEVHISTCDKFEELEKTRLESLKKYMSCMQGFLAAMREEEGRTLDVLNEITLAIDPSSDIQDFTKNSAVGFSIPLPLQFERIARANEEASSSTPEPTSSSVGISIQVPTEPSFSPDTLFPPAPQGSASTRSSMDANMEEIMNLRRELDDERRQKEELKILMQKQESDHKSSSKVVSVLGESLQNERRLHHQDMMSFLANVSRLLEEYEIEIDRFRPQDVIPSIEAPKARRAEKINGQITLLTVKLEAANLRNESLLEELEVMQAVNDELVGQVDKATRDLEAKDRALAERDGDVKRKDDRYFQEVIALKEMIANLESANQELTSKLEAAHRQLEEKQKLINGEKDIQKSNEEYHQLVKKKIEAEAAKYLDMSDALMVELKKVGAVVDNMQKFEGMIAGGKRPLDFLPVVWNAPWGIPVVNAVVTNLSLDTKTMTLTGGTTRTVALEIKENPFDKGTFRFAFYAKVGSIKLVLKEFLGTLGPDGDEKRHREAVKLQMIADHYAKEYNKVKPPYAQPMRYCTAEIYTFTRGGTKVVMFAEELLEGKFVKLNNNQDHVNTEEPIYEEAQAFSHFTWHLSSGKELLCDIQGTVTTPGGFLLTDPALSTSDPAGSGDGNLGPKGIEQFMKKHECNRVCHAMKLRKHPEQK